MIRLSTKSHIVPFVVAITAVQISELTARGRLTMKG
jgi:hypothetical protein